MSEGKGVRTTTPRLLEIALATFKQESVLIMTAYRVFRTSPLGVSGSVMGFKGGKWCFRMLDRL